MAILNWRSRVNIRTEDYQDSQRSFDVHDWRMLKYGLIFSEHHKRSEIGVLISAQEHMRILPHMNIKEFIDANNLGRQATIDQYHTRFTGTVTPICWDCNGIGKLDWIQATCSDRRVPPMDAIKRFVRDERFVYSNPEYKDILFAKARLEPGESHCKLCQGFGIMIDRRFTMFKGMTNLKKGLVQVEV